MAVKYMYLMQLVMTTSMITNVNNHLSLVKIFTSVACIVNFALSAAVPCAQRRAGVAGPSAESNCGQSVQEAKTRGPSG